MKRRDFLRGGLAAGLGALAPGCAFEAGGRYDDFDVAFSGNVLVIGAGASGLAAGYLLDRYGIDYEILEASTRIGGRVLRDETLADFPIDLGAEWLHDEPTMLAQLVDDRSVDASVELVPYSPDTIHAWTGSRVRRVNYASPFYTEYKFRTTNWFGFLERFFAPASAGRIRFDTEVVHVDTSTPRVQVTTAAGATLEADRVLLTVPIKVLKDARIAFAPELSPARADALARVDVPAGLKVFLDFERRFYPDLLLDGGVLRSGSFDKLYYDAAFRKPSERHVLGLFWVSDDAAPMVALDDATIAERTLADLDRIFDGRASRHYRGHVVQNWSADPFVRGAYSTGFDGDQGRLVDTLRAPIDGRVFFAGEALTIAHQSTVHGAMLSAYETVERILAG
ncbi:MAG: NAD(P)/FAD-dependent oxidoreductase [Myxococcota bacterium]